MRTRTRALAFATAAGMPWRLATYGDYLHDYRGRSFQLAASWNGRILLLTKERSAWHIIHEVCHWLVASDKERTLQEFGLSGSPWTDVVSWAKRHPEVDEDQREMDACALQIYASKRLGLPWRAVGSYVNFWDAYDAKTFDAFIMVTEDNVGHYVHLRERGLLDSVDRWTGGRTDRRPRRCTSVCRCARRLPEVHPMTSAAVAPRIARCNPTTKEPR